MKSDLEVTLEFLLRAAEDAPLRTRVSILRTAAEFCGVQQEAANLHQIANDLERADRLCREFKFSTPSPITKPNPKK
ncbi:MAG: hypothetical protein E6R03_13565 [Hyphomicrobiaceae bacterium]|nr:MAG: hypothetical protein E6R03_13565 [Hyphomicrobiaceae bacterium]